VHLKVSSHLLEGVPEPGALVARLAGAFGAERLCWGSDYPQTSLDYAELLARGRAGADALPEKDRDAFLGGTATRLWPGTA
jgi:L-fuconolactonase